MQTKQKMQFLDDRCTFVFHILHILYLAKDCHHKGRGHYKKNGQWTSILDGTKWLVLTFCSQNSGVQKIKKYNKVLKLPIICFDEANIPSREFTR